MAFTVGAIAGKDGTGTTIGGGLLAADIAGGGVGPWFLYNGIVDGVAGSNKAQVDSSNRLAVLASLAAGTNNIGDVDVLTVPSDPFGANADAASATGSISAKLRFIASTGIPITGTVTVGSHAVTNAGTFAVQESGAALTALQLIDDNMVAQGTALGTTKNALMGGSVTTSAPTYTTGQISPLSLDTTGALRVNVTSGGGTGGTSSTVGSAAPSTATAVGFTDGTNMVLAKVKGASTGAAAATDPALVVTLRDVNPNGQTTMSASAPVTIASDQTYGNSTGSAVPSKAMYEGANAITALPTAATAGNLVGMSADKYGRQVTIPITIRDLTGTQTTTISASTSETTIVTAGGAGVFNDLVMLIVSNTSASTNTRVDFRDTTAGSVLFSLQSNGGQPPVGFCPAVAIPQTTANTNWTAQCATSTTDVRIYAVYAKNK